MSVIVASNPWAPAPATSLPRRFAPRLVGNGQRLEWVLRRNCSLTPRQLLGVYLSLCAASLLIAVPFWWHGAGVVLVFAGIEWLVVGLALWVYARHAADSESISLVGDRVLVEHRCGARVERAEFRAAWLRVEPAGGQGSLVELSGEGRRVRVGRYLRADLRAALAQELRRALRWPAGSAAGSRGLNSGTGTLGN